MAPSAGFRLVKNHAGIWYIMAPGDKHGRSTGTRDRAEADKALARRILGGPNSLTVSEALSDYDTERVGSLAQPYIERIRIGHLRKHFGDMAVADITADYVSRYCEARSAGRIGQPSPASNTHRRELAILVAAINHHLAKPAIERRLSADAAPAIVLPAMSAPRSVWLEPHEETELLLACFRGPRAASIADAEASVDTLPRVYVFTMLGLETAARQSAIRGLTVDRVNLAAGFVDYREPGRAETKKRRAIVPISDRLRPVIERAVRETESDHVLGWSGAIKRAFGTACRVAARRLSEAGHHESARKLATQVTPHVLRHTYATMALRHGVTLWDVAGVLGDTVETVRAVYGHHSPEHLRRAVNYRENKELVSGPVLLPAMVENEN